MTIMRAVEVAFVSRLSD